MKFYFFISFFYFCNSCIIDRFYDWYENYNIKINDYNHLENIFTNWKENDKFIHDINNKNLTLKSCHNAYSGMNNSEFKNIIKKIYMYP